MTYAKNARIRLSTCILSVLLFACQAPSPPLQVVDSVDLERYQGRWYEIASFPQRFQKGCTATTAVYSRRQDGRIRVDNSCRDGSLDGPMREAEGVAWQTDPDGSSAKLAVRFFWPFYGSYWVIELAPDYEWAVVGHPSRDYLWILSRSPQMDPATYQMLLGRIEAHGYELSRLERTLQPAGR